ncbi:SCF ubiquitin ligase complex subunit [Microbotryomycetes sp. JL221]|nr:SCF ubiquitin ligase complex subunit [Microbotryomycetes sp. JL221]
MATNGLAPHTSRASSRSPSITSTSGRTSDRDAPVEQDDESADDDESEFGGNDDDPAASRTSLAIRVPALATPRPSISAKPWPYMSLDQMSPTLGSQSDERTIPASSLPHEILLHILRLLPAPSLAPALLVCKAWCQCGVELLWHKPSFTTLEPLSKMLQVIHSPDQTFPYPQFIRRLNFSSLHDEMTDATLSKLAPCTRLERLTLAGSKQVGSQALVDLLTNCPRLIALDLSDVPDVEDNVAEAVAKNCPKVQGLNLSGCKQLTDRGLQAIARGCPELRRIKLRNCDNLSDTTIILLSQLCPLLLEVDVVFCTRITSLALHQLFRTSHHLRELSLQGCSDVTDDGFPTQRMVSTFGSKDVTLDDETMEDGEPLVANDGSLVIRPPKLYALPKLRMLENLRFLDLTSLTSLTDGAIAGIIKYMPKIRNLILAKCSRLTDEAVYSICHLGKHLHYLHLGHVTAITDTAVTTLARCCTRLRYIDLANCQQLTDMSVFELASNLPRLKRIGLVRVANITDQAIYALHVRTSLERIHLSYCENITVLAIHELLQRLTRLTHLSLTGVPAFRRPDLQTWCRMPPREFNSHQRATFCVYSGKGVHELRRYLRTMFAEQGAAEEAHLAVRNGNGRPVARNLGLSIPPHNPRAHQTHNSNVQHQRTAAVASVQAGGLNLHPQTFAGTNNGTGDGQTTGLAAMRQVAASSRQVPIQFRPTPALGAHQAAASSRTSVPAIATSSSAAFPLADGWQWDPRAITNNNDTTFNASPISSNSSRSNSATEQPRASIPTSNAEASTGTSTDAAQAAIGRRARGQTVTFANYRDDESDMHDQAGSAQRSPWADGDEEDVEMS